MNRPWPGLEKSRDVGGSRCWRRLLPRVLLINFFCHPSLLGIFLWVDCSVTLPKSPVSHTLQINTQILWWHCHCACAAATGQTWSSVPVVLLTSWMIYLSGHKRQRYNQTYHWNDCLTKIKINHVLIGKWKWILRILKLLQLFMMTRLYTWTVIIYGVCYFGS